MVCDVAIGLRIGAAPHVRPYGTSLPFRARMSARSKASAPGPVFTFASSGEVPLARITTALDRHFVLSFPVEVPDKLTDVVLVG